MIRMISILFIFSLFLPISKVYSEPNFDMMVYPTIRSYAKEIGNCDVGDLTINSLGDVKNICKGLVESSVCEYINEDDLLDCSKLYQDSSLEYELAHDYNPYGSVPWACLKGFGKGTVNVVQTILSGLITIGGVSYGLVEDNKIANNFYESLGILEGYYLDAYDEEILTGDSNFPVLSSLWRIMYNYFENEFTEFGCLNAHAKQKVICSFATEVGLSAVAGGFAFAIVKSPVKSVSAIVKSPFKVVSKIRGKGKPSAKKSKQSKAKPDQSSSVKDKPPAARSGSASGSAAKPNQKSSGKGKKPSAAKKPRSARTSKGAARSGSASSSAAKPNQKSSVKKDPIVK